MAKGKVAFLVLNPLSIPQQLTMPLSDIPGNPCGGQRQLQGGERGPACTLRDVWAGKDTPLSSSSLQISLEAHESMVWILSLSAASAQ
jgi:hypothetical protein